MKVVEEAKGRVMPLKETEIGDVFRFLPAKGCDELSQFIMLRIWGVSSAIKMTRLDGEKKGHSYGSGTGSTWSMSSDEKLNTLVEVLDVTLEVHN